MSNKSNRSVSIYVNWINKSQMEIYTEIVNLMYCLTNQSYDLIDIRSEFTLFTSDKMYNDIICKSNPRTVKNILEKLNSNLKIKPIKELDKLRLYNNGNELVILIAN